MRAAPPGSPIDSPRRGPGGSLHYATDGRDILFNSPDGWEVDSLALWWTDPDGTFGNPPPGAGDPAGLSYYPGGVQMHVADLRHDRRPAVACVPRRVRTVGHPQLDHRPPVVAVGREGGRPGDSRRRPTQRGRVLHPVDHRRTLVRRRLPVRPHRATRRGRPARRYGSSTPTTSASKANTYWVEDIRPPLRLGDPPAGQTALLERSRSRCHLRPRHRLGVGRHHQVATPPASSPPGCPPAI